MDFFQVINQRRSVRKYKDSIVPEEVIQKALEAALKAPNSSNLQPWEFYWVRSPEVKNKVRTACLNQGAARTASDLVVAVARIDSWDRHRKLVLQNLKDSGQTNPGVEAYYGKLIPFFYATDPFGILGLFRFIAFNVAGLFKPMVRRPAFKSDIYEVVAKTTALACENFMLAVTAQGYGSCPMEGFDEVRLKSILGIHGKARIVMVMSVGEVDPAGIWGEQFRVDPKLTVFRL